MQKNSENTDSLPHVHRHDHQSCIESAVGEAEAVALKARKKLSANSWDVLRILLDAHTAFGAYEICESLSELGIKLQATQVYRALDQLTSLGIAHRIECKNAFIACCGGAQCRDPQFLICTDCGHVDEMMDLSLSAVVDVAAKQAEFLVEMAKIEIHGLCRRCQPQNG